ncbi:hypothetical protein H5410_022186 [Solanum commersonii]|uniref:Uncharacterized protein n=1 Tax=Solanum commersonii TaxID=4109 RepID=A0A9J5ZDH6_SOLCO|nr:hypothetical protein H5410_022186 [Solanum commersonii]
MPINTNKQLQDVGSSSFSTNRFANLQDEETFEESEEEDMLNYCLANAARDADISPRQQRNNKKKHGRKNSWDGVDEAKVVGTPQIKDSNHLKIVGFITRLQSILLHLKLQICLELFVITMKDVVVPPSITNTNSEPLNVTLPFHTCVSPSRIPPTMPQSSLPTPLSNQPSSSPSIESLTNHISPSFVAPIVGLTSATNSPSHDGVSHGVDLPSLSIVAENPHSFNTSHAADFSNTSATGMFCPAASPLQKMVT